MTANRKSNGVSRRIMQLLLILLYVSFGIPATGYGSDFVLLYSNDIRGETEPCG